MDDKSNFIVILGKYWQKCFVCFWGIFVFMNSDSNWYVWNYINIFHQNNSLWSPRAHFLYFFKIFGLLFRVYAVNRISKLKYDNYERCGLYFVRFESYPLRNMIYLRIRWNTALWRYPFVVKNYQNFNCGN